MNKKRKFNRGIKYLLLVALAISSFLLLRLTAFAADNGLKNVNGNKKITEKLIGQYSLNYTGNINFYGNEKQGASGGSPNTVYNTWDGNGAFSGNYDKIKKNLEKGFTNNSTFARLEKSNGATGIKAAYLVWQTSVQGKDSEVTVLKEAQRTPVYFAAANGSLQTVTPQYAAVDARNVQNGTTKNNDTGETEDKAISYTFSCMYADVTSYVQKYGFTTYGVAGIPYALSKKYNKDTGSHMGESCSNWQLIVVEENPKQNVRAVAIKVGSQFNYTWEDNPNPSSDKKEDQYIWKDNPMTMNLNLDKYWTKKYSDENTGVKGQLMVIGISSVTTEEGDKDKGKFSVTIKDKDKNKAAKTLNHLVQNSYLYKDDTVAGTYSESAIRGKICNFTIDGKDKNSPGFDTNNFSVSVTDRTWVTLYAVGMAVDIADYDPVGKQDTKIEDNKVTITGSETVNTDQKNTGYYNGSMAVTLDEDLEKPESASFTVYNKQDGSTKTFKYSGSNTDDIKYDANRHTLTFKNRFYTNIGNGSYVKYTVTAPLKDEPEKATITNRHQVTGMLCSVGAQTSIEKKHPEVTSSAKVPFPAGAKGYFTLKVVGTDGTTSKIKIKVITDTKDFINASEVNARFSIVGSESTNKHGVTLVDADGNPVSQVQYKLAPSVTTLREVADQPDKYYVKRDDGTIVYKSKWKTTVPNLRIRYDKEAYTYAVGATTKSDGSSRMNTREYSWDHDKSKPNTLNNMHVWHNDVEETIFMQINVSNMGISYVDGVVPVNGEYTITLKHPELEITYQDGESDKAKSYTQKNDSHLIYKAGASVDLMNTTNAHLNFKKNGYEPVTEKEWYKKKSDGTKKYYDQDARYLLEKVKNFTDGDDFKTKNVTLYVNWKKVQDEITVYYRSAGTGDSSDKWKNNNTPSAHCTDDSHKHSAYYHLDGNRTIMHAVMDKKSHTVKYTEGGKKKSETCNYLRRQKDSSGNLVYSYSKTTIKKSEIDAKTATIDLLNTTTALNAPAGTSATGYWRIGSISGPKISYDALSGDDAVRAYHRLSQYADSDRKVYVYADWKGKSHTLAFDENGGKLPDGGAKTVTITVRSSDHHDVSWNTPSRKGYTFLGWYDAPSGGTQVYDEDGLCKNEGKYWSGSVCVYDGDYTVYAHWKAREASYTVRHWKQKADGNAAIHDQNNYDLAETATKKAKIGAKVTPPVKTYAGFVSPAVQTGTVTADGKLVIDYFYERQFYNVTLHAGTGIEAVYGGGAYRYGQSVTIDASLKTGYHWSHWSGSFEQDTKNYTFTMPMSNVELTANGEANKYTIHFDPNGGSGHIDDIVATYDEDVVLPGIIRADGTAAYEKYTLDGVNVTGDVISGVIPKGMMAGYEEEENGEEENEEIEESEETENPDADGDDSENQSDGPEENQDNKNDSVEKESDKEGESVENSSEKEQEDSDNMENTESGSMENDDEEKNDEESNDEDATEISEDTGRNEKAAAPVKKVYASVFMGWSLENGRNTFIPQWKAGDAVRNLVAEDGGEITLYAIWDDCPWIQANDLYYTLDQAQRGVITEAEILSHATASDREDGSPIAPGTNPAASDPALFTSFTIPDYQTSEFTNLQHDFSATENLTVVDHVGNTYIKQITVHVTDTTPKEITQMDLTGVTRFINSKYYNKTFDEGGLEDNSIWKVNPEYKAALESALNNMNNDTPAETYVFSKETIKQMKQYVETHGIGNSKEPDALNNFYHQFLAPNKQ